MGAVLLAQIPVATGPQHWSHDVLRPPPSTERGHHPCEAHSPGHDLHRMLSGGGDPRSPFPSPHCAWTKFSAAHVQNPQKNIPSLGDALEGLLDLAVDSKPPAARARRGRGLDNITSKLCGKDIVSASQWLAGLRGDSFEQIKSWPGSLQLAHLLLLALVAGFSASTSALACDRRDLLHLATVGASLHELTSRRDRKSVV